jgi:hypothetical protein
MMTSEQRGSHDLLTVAEVGRILRWNPMTVYRYIASGLIPPWAVVALPHRGKRTSRRIKRAWLESVLAGNAKEK